MICPANDIDIETHRLSADAAFPNNPDLPLLVYRQALDSPDPQAVMQTMIDHGWEGAWRNGVFDFHHFHANAHEVLAICTGSASIQFGGPNGPVVDVQTGDVAILPAGTAHKNQGSSGDLLVVGAYPPGQSDYDMHRGDPDELSQVRAKIAQVDLPQTDPLLGSDGPLLEQWKDRAC